MTALKELCFLKPKAELFYISRIRIIYTAVAAITLKSVLCFRLCSSAAQATPVASGMP